ncbi:MAG: hypothetical protein Q9227_006447 [Pyrenula ochraceoflavens]
MQATPGPQRSSQRRSPAAASVEPAASYQPSRNYDPPPDAGQRIPSVSAKSQMSKPPPQQDKQISQIEKSVTHLLVATKQLLETLTQWSRKQATEEEVSDVYVRLGYEFNLACRAFSSIGVETADLGPVPDLLRNILEDTLSQTASPQSLDRYLPRIRDIIINLLHGLKRKQAKLRNRPSRDPRSGSATPPARQQSSTNLADSDAELSQSLENLPSGQAQPTRGQSARYEKTPPATSDDATIPRSTSAPGSSGRPMPSEPPPRRDSQKTFTQSSSSSSISNSTIQSIPALPPGNEESQGRPQATPTPASSFPPPPPPPKQQDALAALQRGGDLERRASRRFSAYQISKHLGASPTGIPVLPPSQNSPVPNRGRDVRESMKAVQSRGSVRHSRQRPTSRVGDLSPTRQTQLSQSISEEATEDLEPPQIPAPAEAGPDDSPIAKTPEDKYSPPLTRDNRDLPELGPTLSGPPSTDLHVTPTPDGPIRRTLSRKQSRRRPKDGGGDKIPSALPDTTTASRDLTPPRTQQFTPEDSPPPGKELTLFLQYRSKIKKYVLTEGYEGLTIARLQLAFIEKFAWNTHNNGADLPEIYVQDPVSGVRHELEDLTDVKDRSVLVLNVEVLDEVKKHFDDGLDDVRRLVEGVRNVIDDQGVMMQRFSDRQLEASKDMARIAATPSTQVNAPRFASAKSKAARIGSSPNTVNELQSLRRDIAVLRQSYSNMSSDFVSSMDSIRAKGANIKSVAKIAALPTFEGDAGRAHVNSGKKSLLKDSEELVNRVDDMTDLVEDLRKDVVTRGVRPLPRQLEDTSKDISSLVKELAKVKDFIKREKPVWTKIWEKELNVVCQERDELTQQEELMADLTGDLKDVTDVFQLVEEATKQQNLQNGPTIGIRTASRSLPVETDVDPRMAKDGVLGEVRALQPNHENRLEAIERAEKARQRELESRKGGEFQREIADFVEEGKLKKTGGAEEVDRLRKIKDERARKENFELLAQRRAAMEEREHQAATAPLADTTTEGADEATDNAGSDHLEGRHSDDAETQVKPVEPSTDEQSAEATGPNNTSPTKRSSWIPNIFSGS